MPTLGVPASFADIPTSLKCVKVYIPDGTDIHLYALRGQLSNLGKSWWWDTGGDVDLAREIASWWIAASEATDLTAACEDCDMDINVNVNCGCGGGIPTTILCYDQNGNPIITPQPPVDPTVPNPVGDTWPVDPNSDPAPDGFGDWTTFDAEACAASNGVWQAAYFMVTLAEGAIDLLATILAIMAFVVAELPVVITTVISGGGVLKYAEGLVRVLLSEQATDVLNEIKTWLVDNKQEIVCTIFQYRHDIPGMQIELVRMMHAWLYVALTLDIEEEAAIIEFGRSIFPLNLLLAYFFQFQVYMESSSPIDCSLCVSPIGWGMSKEAGIADPVTVPPGGTYSGSGWIGGIVWESVQVGNYIQYDNWVSNGETTITYTFTTASDSAVGAPIDAILSIIGDTIVVPVLATTSPNMMYTGSITIPAEYIGGFFMGVGGKLTSWEWFAS